MFKNTTQKAALYPCGVCAIGVKYSAIRCTGLCIEWFHAKCVNLSDKILKNMVSSEIETWICSECNISKKFCKTNISAEENFEPDPGDSMLNTVTDAVVAPTNPNSPCTENNISSRYLENSLRENDLTNEEDRLKMGATIGMVLLEENQLLRGQIAILENRVASSEAIMGELKENGKTVRHRKRNTDKEAKRLKAIYLTCLQRHELTGAQADKNKMCEAKKDYDMRLKTIKRQAAADHIANAENKSKALWQVINSQRGKKRSNAPQPQLNIK
ncbi:hypothetical protein J6590_041025 [Homalodisca vitripennis]|nr:hypothetical protein J6590_041025 [Homalodisca vitripennis]